MSCLCHTNCPNKSFWISGKPLYFQGHIRVLTTHTHKKNDAIRNQEIWSGWGGYSRLLCRHFFGWDPLPLVMNHDHNTRLSYLVLFCYDLCIMNKVLKEWKSTQFFIQKSKTRDLSFLMVEARFSSCSSMRSSCSMPI